MGCTNSTEAQESALQQRLNKQKAQLAALQTSNSRLKQAINGLQAEKRHLDSTPKPDLPSKVQELEAKLAALEEKVVGKREDTMSRGSRVDSPMEILLDSKQGESAPMSEARSSHTIMDDPLIREMYERKRQMFLLQKHKEAKGEQDSQPQISPTMTSTYVSNKLA